MQHMQQTFQTSHKLFNTVLVCLTGSICRAQPGFDSQCGVKSNMVSTAVKADD